MIGLRFFTSLRCVQNDMVGCSPLGIKGGHPPTPPSYAITSHATTNVTSGRHAEKPNCCRGRGLTWSMRVDLRVHRFSVNLV